MFWWVHRPQDVKLSTGIVLLPLISSQLTQTGHCYTFSYTGWISKWQAYKSAVCSAEVFWCWFQLPRMQKGWGGTCKHSSNELGATNAVLENSYYLPYLSVTKLASSLLAVGKHNHKYHWGAPGPSKTKSVKLNMKTLINQVCNLQSISRHFYQPFLCYLPHYFPFFENQSSPITETRIPSCSACTEMGTIYSFNIVLNNLNLCHHKEIKC